MCIQWQYTYCPGCGYSSEHALWYTNTIAHGEISSADQIELIKRKTVIENRLLKYGMQDNRISYLPYLKFSADEFQTTYEVGCRILVLWAVSYLASNPGEKQEIEKWLKSTVLWDKVSEREKKIFTEELPERTLMDFSWNIEAVIVLCWAVSLLEELPDIDVQISDKELDILMCKIADRKRSGFLFKWLNLSK